MSLTVPRLIEFVAADLDILREYWRIRKDKKKIKIEDVKTFANKLDVLIEFWQRLQVLNNKGGNCTTCLLRKREKPDGGKIKHKEASCQTASEDHRVLDQTVSSSIGGLDDDEQATNQEQDIEEEVAARITNIQGGNVETVLPDINDETSGESSEVVKNEASTSSTADAFTPDENDVILDDATAVIESPFLDPLHCNM